MQKRYVIGLVLFSLLLLVAITDARAGNICFDESTASKMVMELEKGQLEEAELIVQREANSELQKQIDLLKQMNELQKEQASIQAKMIEQYKEIIKVQQDAMKAQEPSFIEQIKKAAGFIAIGVLVGILL